ncbi:MAG: bifunctional phosphopantothenoylcysteine decarboxylase/phosphopantothenate--cysteine ligase CoaBC [Gemmatimonadetes bacterium]|nr:bifunctional phosphopantothenoylcysteine decarboxylase/phosphopantothenate--cysteine ligase CoaBC [Gemmatimonadota bacterium]
MLGISGGIAAYKSVQIARSLTQLGAEVDVVMTTSARAFVGAITFEALTGRPVLSDILEEGHALAHIRLAREADVVCIAPATADLIARAAQGRADDLLTAILLATRAPVVLCAAMNDAMWSHTQTQANLAHVSTQLGYRIAGPGVGPLAHGEGAGPGRMLEPEDIVEHIGRALEAPGPLTGERVIVTAGPTREPVDAVRVLSNRSSGRMGYALAAAAWRRGADVTLISGPAALTPPVGARVLRVGTAEEMARALRSSLPAARVLIMAAAVADFRPAEPPTAKLRRSDGPPELALAPAVDVLASTHDARPQGLVAVGFALETGDGRTRAKEKLTSKDLDLIVLNDATEDGAGFEVETNRVTLIDREGNEQDVPLQAKTEVAEVILDRIERLLAAP